MQIAGVTVDKIGVVVDHRWMPADKQAEVLAPRNRIVVSLGGGRSALIKSRSDRDDLLKWCRPGTVIELVHAFLLADQRHKRQAGGLRKDFRVALAAIEKRGAQVFDVTADVGSDKRKALLAVVDTDIGRSTRGRSSKLNGHKSTRGKAPADFTAEQMEKAEGIWGNRKKYPKEKDTKAPLAAIVSPNGRKFTRFRARREFGNRT